MATKKKSTSKKPSSGSDPKSKRIVKRKMGETMREYKQHELKSGGGGEKVTNPKQAIAIGLSEARQAGADIPPSPNQKKTAKKTAKKSSSKAAKKSTTKRTAPKKTVTKKTPTRKKK